MTVRILFFLMLVSFFNFPFDLYSQKVLITTKNSADLEIEFLVSPIQYWGLNSNVDSTHFIGGLMRPTDGETLSLDLPDTVSYMIQIFTNGKLSTFSILKGFRKHPLELTLNSSTTESNSENSLTVESDSQNSELGALNTAFMNEMKIKMTIVRQGKKNLNRSELNKMKAVYIQKMRDSKQPILVRQLYAYLSANPIDTNIVENNLKKEILKICPPSSDIWSLMNPSTFQTITTNDDGSIDTNVVRQFAFNNPNAAIRAGALGKLAAYYQSKGDHFEVMKIIATIKKQYPEHYEMATIHINNVDSDIQGKVPDFNFLLLDTGTKITNNDLKGSYYLIDFWGTWCSGCRMEIPNLTKQYEKYAPHGFKIISVAMFNTPLEIMKFRNEKFEMPWMHVVLDKEKTSSIVSQFEVRYTPSPFLIDPNGNVIAKGYESLTGENLGRKLKEIYGF